jgi:hypothetical protein
MQFELRSDVDPLVVLAERPFGEHHLGDGPVIWVALLANLPAALSAALAAAFLEADLGRLASTRLGTGVFFVVSSAQWLGLAWGFAVLRRRASAHWTRSAHP